MSTSSRLVFGAGVVLLLMPPRIGFAQTLPPTDYPWVRALIRAAFPELTGNGNLIGVTFHGQLDSDNDSPVVMVTVRRPTPLGYAEQGPVVLSAVFSEKDRASFDLIDKASNDALRSITREAEAQPEWTESDLVVALHRAQADYPFDRREAFLRHLDINRFAPVLGAIQRVETDFVWRRPEAPHIVVIRWRVRLQTLASDGRARMYILAFEPMHGSLVSLYRKP